MAETRGESVQPPHPPQPPAGGAAPSGLGISLRLVALRHLMKLMLLAQRAAVLLSAALAAAVVLGVIDYVLRSPAWLRTGLLAVGLSVLGVAAWRRLMPVARFAPSLADLALRLERTPGGEREGLPGVLASGLELAPRADDPRVLPLVKSAGERIARLTPMAMLRVGPTLAAGGVLAAVVLGVMGLAVAQPGLTAIGAQRVLLPWTKAAWPKRTAIADVTETLVHPLGTALPLRAALITSGGVSAEDARVQARYRLIDEAGEAGPVRRVVLTSQGREIDAPPAGDGPGASIGGLAEAAGVAGASGGANAAAARRGVLMERLLEPAALEVEATGTSTEAQLEYWLESDDDQTDPRRVLLVRPPRVEGARAVVTPPAYAAALGVPRREVDLGAGVDERALLEDVLEGSRVELTLTLSRAIPVGNAQPGRAELAALLGEGFASAVLDGAGGQGGQGGAGGSGASGVEVSLGEREWRLAWPARGSVSVLPRPVDQHGIETDAEPAYRVIARADRVPEAVVLQPAEDVEVLPTASVEVRVEGRDDLGLASVRATAQAARRRAGTQSSAVEPTGEPVELAAARPEAGTAARVLTASATLDLPGLKAKAGDEYWVVALAADSFELDGRAREASRSGVRKVRVISPEQLAEQVWAELSSLRRSAINLAEQQDRLERATREPGELPAAASRDQGAVAEGVSRQEQTLERLGQRLERNGLENDELSGVLESAGSLLKQAQESAAGAQQSLRDAERARREDAGERGEQRARAERERAAQQQDAAQRALEDLAGMLDQGRDAWSARRGVERLRRDQQALREQTARLGQQTVGRSADELKPEERAQAENLAQQQEDLAQRAQEAVDTLRQKAEQLKEQDPSAAAALEQAAARAQRAQVQEQMQRTAEQIRQNRQQAANQQQDAVLRALEQVLEQMDQAGRDRDERLSRELASLIESIQGLIARQKQELDLLAAAEGKGDFAGLDASLIALRTQTLGVADQARSSGREGQASAGQLEQAAASQATGIARLRAEPPAAEEAREAEQKALEHLEAALTEAQKAQNQANERSSRRQRGELRRAYAELLAAQSELRGRTQDAANLEAGRRQRAAARDLAQPQDELRRKLAELKARTGEIAESELFAFAHERIDRAMNQAATRLSEGEAGGATLVQQAAAARVLQSLIDALGNDEQQKDPFREMEQQGGGGGGGGGRPPGLIPPTAELKLLRTMQDEALSTTREAAGTTDEAARRAAVVEAARLQGDLAERAEKLLERLKREQSPGQRPAAPPGAEPAKPDEPAPAGDAPAGGAG
jgi:hypothetical protein